MIRTTIDAGVCGFRTTVTARSDDMQTVGLQILGDCQKIRGVAEALQVPIDAYKEIGDGSDGVVLSAARTHLTGCCAGCAVPSGIFKSVQVAGSVALPAPISFTDDGVGQGPLRPADRTAAGPTLGVAPSNRRCKLGKPDWPLPIVPNRVWGVDSFSGNSRFDLRRLSQL